MKRKIASYFAVGLLLIFVFGWGATMLNGCSKKEEQPNAPTVIKNNPPDTKSGNYPQFKKEGELKFLKADATLVASIDIEIAETPAEQQQGLMNRPSMEEMQGMLFIFNREFPQSFWMKNTIISLDIIYVNAQKQIVSIAKDAQPYSTESLPSAAPAQYVVEVIAGFTDKYELKPGDRVEWNRI